MEAWRGRGVSSHLEGASERGRVEKLPEKDLVVRPLLSEF